MLAVEMMDPRNTLILFAILLAVLGSIAAWSVVLRRRVRRQTRAIGEQLTEAQTLRMRVEHGHREQNKSQADILSLQKDLVDAHEKLDHQGTRDPLTGLWNRAAVLDLFHSEMERSLRTRSPIGVLLVDIDQFRPLNETLGREAGDAVLKEVGVRLSHATRPYDVAGRCGGEEFLVILADCDRDQTESSAERIRATIAALPFLIAGTEISLTVSIGATVALDYTLGETEILSLADLALYQAKSAGRNCTVVRTSFQEEHAGTA
jgi:diguanylate cyclase (GGDEF)-like protein